MRREVGSPRKASWRGLGRCLKLVAAVLQENSADATTGRSGPKLRCDEAIPVAAVADLVTLQGTSRIPCHWRWRWQKHT